ncbi:MAG: hypothetical protein K9M56_04340 [Victivallales bacterium]|nr:hypothetical protein [Victivallales bacterium]
MNISLKGLMIGASEQLEKQPENYNQLLSVLLKELYENLEELREDPEKHNRFFELYPE